MKSSEDKLDNPVTNDEIKLLPRWANLSLQARCARHVVDVCKGSPQQLLLRSISNTELSADAAESVPWAWQDYLQAHELLEQIEYRSPKWAAVAAANIVTWLPESNLGITMHWAVLAAPAKAADIRRDFDFLLEAADSQGWDDSTAVGPELFVDGTLPFLLSRVNAAIGSAIQSCMARSWREDLITESVLRALVGRIPRFEIGDRSVSWDAYKLSGPIEHERGDVAVLVRTTYGTGEIIEGVGYIEAKRVSPKGKFAAIKWPQLERMVRGCRHHQVLLYDLEIHKRLLRSDIESVATIVPTDFVLARRKKDRSMYAQGTSLAGQLCQRYLSGFDLEYDEASVAAAKGYIHAVDAPRFLLVAEVNQSAVSDSLPIDSQRLNQNLFNEIRQSGSDEKTV